MAQTQNYPPEMIENLSAAFVRRAENSYAWGSVMSYYLGLPQLRGFWPTSSVDENGDVYDLSGQGRTLANNNAATFSVYGLQSYVNLDGISQYLSRPNEAGVNITGAVTFGCWVRFGSITTTQIVIGRNDAGTNNRSFRITFEIIKPKVDDISVCVWGR